MPAVITALPLYHIFALTTNARVHAGRRQQRADHESARLAGLRGRTRRTASRSSPASTRCSTRCCTRRASTELDFSSAAASASAAAWPCSARWPNNGSRSPGNVLTRRGDSPRPRRPRTVNRPRSTDFNGSIGFPHPLDRVTIRDDDGNELPHRPVGRDLRARAAGDARLLEPARRDREGHAAGRVLRTGDIGHMDERGSSFIEDRKKDMILVSGFNVYPNEVEGVRRAHAGRARSRGGGAARRARRRSRRAVHRAQGPGADREDSRSHCRTRELTGYKVPKHVYFRDELPKTNVGKILRRTLRDELR